MKYDELVAKATEAGFSQDEVDKRLAGLLPRLFLVSKKENIPLEKVKERLDSLGLPSHIYTNPNAAGESLTSMTDPLSGMEQGITQSLAKDVKNEPLPGIGDLFSQPGIAAGAKAAAQAVAPKPTATGNLLPTEAEWIEKWRTGVEAPFISPFVREVGNYLIDLESHKKASKAIGPSPSLMDSVAQGIMAAEESLVEFLPKSPTELANFAAIGSMMNTGIKTSLFGLSRVNPELALKAVLPTESMARATSDADNLVRSFESKLGFKMPDAAASGLKKEYQARLLYKILGLHPEGVTNKIPVEPGQQPLALRPEQPQVAPEAPKAPETATSPIEPISTLPAKAEAMQIVTEMEVIGGAQYVKPEIAVSNIRPGQGKFEIGETYFNPHPNKDASFRKYDKMVVVAGPEINGKIPVYSVTGKGAPGATGLPSGAYLPELTPKNELLAAPRPTPPPAISPAGGTLEGIEFKKGYKGFATAEKQARSILNKYGDSKIDVYGSFSSGIRRGSGKKLPDLDLIIEDPKIEQDILDFNKETIASGEAYAIKHNAGLRPQDRGTRFDTPFDAVGRLDLPEKYLDLSNKSMDVKVKINDHWFSARSDGTLRALGDSLIKEQLINRKPLKKALEDFRKNYTETKTGEPTITEVIKATKRSGKQTNTDNFKKWFGESKVVDKGGKPMVVYHGTTDKISRFRVSSGLAGHFGSSEAAGDRLVQRAIDVGLGPKGQLPGSSIVPVFLSIRNPVRMSDVHFDESLTMVDDLKERGIFNTKEWMSVNRGNNNIGIGQMVRMLKSKGYDGIVYQNKIEGQGDDTFIPFSSKQIKFALLEQPTPPKSPEPAKARGGELESDPYEAERRKAPRFDPEGIISKVSTYKISIPKSERWKGELETLTKKELGFNPGIVTTKEGEGLPIGEVVDSMYEIGAIPEKDENSLLAELQKEIQQASKGRGYWITAPKGHGYGTQSLEYPSKNVRLDDLQARVNPIIATGGDVTAAIDVGVPAGTKGKILDIDPVNELLLADFGKGPILVSPDELNETAIPGKPFSQKDPITTGTEKYNIKIDEKGVQGLDASEWQSKLEREAKTTDQTNKVKIQEFVERAFDVPVRGKVTSHMGRQAGHFEVNADLIRMKKWGELEVLTHEVAHHIDKILKGTIGPKWLDSVFDLSHFPKSAKKEILDLDYNQNLRRKEEGFAEYIRHRMTTGKERYRAPDFDEGFNKLLENQPELKGNLDELKRLYGIWREQGSENRILNQIDFSGEIKRTTTFSEKAEDVVGWIQKKFFEEFWTIKKVEESIGRTSRKEVRPTQSAYEMATFVKQKARGIARTFVEEAAIDEFGNKVGPSLISVLEPIKYGEMRSFIAYATARRALVLSNRGIETGFDIGDAKYIVEKNKNPIWDGVVDGLTAWSNHGIDWLVRAGGLGPAEAQVIRDLNPVYLPFKRVFIDEVESGMMGGSAAIAKQGTPVKRLKGSGRPIINPMESLIESMAQMIGMAHKIRIANLVADWTKIPGTGKHIVKIPPPMEYQKLSVEAISEALEEKGVMLKDIPGEESSLESVLNVLTQASQFKGKANVISIWRDGKRQYFELSEDLYAALNGVEEIHLGPLTKILAPFARLQRMGATQLKASFALFRNPFRDVLSYLAFTKRTTFNIFDPLIGSYKDVFTEPGSITERFKFAGGEISSQMGYDRAATMAMYDEILVKKMPHNLVLKVVKHPIDAMRFILQVPELGPRIAELERNYPAYKKEHPDWTDEDCFVAAFNDAQDVTVNFSRSGSWGKRINSVVAFFNAGVQGLSKLSREATGNPLRLAIRGIAAISSLALYSWYENKDKQWYKNLPDAYKYNNLFFEVGGNIIRLPIPFELGAVFAALPVAVVESMSQGELKTHFKALGNVVASQFPNIAPSAFGPLIDVATNRDFSGRPIESVGMQYVPHWERRKYYTTNIANGLSRAVNSIGIPASPVQIDYLISGYTGGLPKQFAFRGIKELSDWPVIVDIILRAPENPRRQIEAMFREKEELSQKKKAKMITKDERKRLEQAESAYNFAYRPHHKALVRLMEKGASPSDIRKEYRLMGLSLKRHGFE